MLERLVEEMDRQPDVVNCYPATVLIDADGHQTGFSYRNDAFAARPSQRLKRMLAVDGLCLATYGLLRSDVLRQTLPEQNYTSGDHAFLAELALRGRFHLVPELLFYKRKHPGNTWRDPIRQMVWFRPDLAMHGATDLPALVGVRGIHPSRPARTASPQGACEVLPLDRSVGGEKATRSGPGAGVRGRDARPLASLASLVLCKGLLSRGYRFAVRLAVLWPVAYPTPIRMSDWAADSRTTTVLAPSQDPGHAFPEDPGRIADDEGPLRDVRANDTAGPYDRTVTDLHS